MTWQPIETAPRAKHILCSHAERKWVRIGWHFPGLNRWYYSGTNERNQYSEGVDDDKPTHWMPLPAPPEPGA